MTERRPKAGWKKICSSDRQTRTLLTRRRPLLSIAGILRIQHTSKNPHDCSFIGENALGDGRKPVHLQSKLSHKLQTASFRRTFVVKCQNSFPPKSCICLSFSSLLMLIFSFLWCVLHDNLGILRRGNQETLRYHSTLRAKFKDQHEGELPRPPFPPVFGWREEGLELVFADKLPFREI